MPKLDTNKLVEGLNLPPDHTYIWRVSPKGTGTNSVHSKFGSSSRGLKSALRWWNIETQIQIISEPNFKTAWEGYLGETY